MDSYEIVADIEKNSEGFFLFPMVYFFKKENLALYDDVIKELKKKNFNLIDINQCAIITKEDYNILPQGYRLDDDGNKRIIIKSKISKVLNRIDKHSVLLVTYNYLYKCNDLFYSNEKKLLI